MEWKSPSFAQTPRRDSPEDERITGLYRPLEGWMKHLVRSNLMDDQNH